MAMFDGTLTLSTNLDYFEHRGTYFVYHNLFGYIIELSRDLLDFLEYFRGTPRDERAMRQHFKGTYESSELAQFINVFELQACLISDEISEEDMALRMVPVHAMSTVYHEPAEGPVTLYNALRSVSDSAEVTELNDWESTFWRSIDEERTLTDILDILREHPDSPNIGLEKKLLALVFQFTHCEAQFLKLSTKTMTHYRAANTGRGVPPYLRSTMPFVRVTDEVRGETSVRIGLDVLDDAEISSSGLASDQIESTFAHLFRHAHTGLQDRTYGGAMAHTLKTREPVMGGAVHLENGARILEIATATGSLACGFLDELRSTDPDMYASVHYTALVEEEAQIKAVTEFLSAAGHTDCVTVKQGAMAALSGVEDLEPEGFDLIICNEALARLETVLLRKITVGSEDEEEEEEAEGEEGAKKSNGSNGSNGKQARDMYMGEGDSVNVVFRHNLTFHDVRGEFLFNVGAVRFVEQASKLLAEGGALVLIEYGELFDYPEMTGEPGDEQWSIHFGTLQNVGKSLGLKSAFEWLVSWLEGIDRGAQMLVTNRHYFRALRHFLETKGNFHLENRAYTRTMIELLISEHMNFDEVHRLDYRSLNDRVMGLVTSSIKVLEFVRPLPGDELPKDEEPEEVEFQEDQVSDQDN